MGEKDIWKKRNVYKCWKWNWVTERRCIWALQKIKSAVALKDKGEVIHLLQKMKMLCVC